LTAVVAAGEAEPALAVVVNAATTAATKASTTNGLSAVESRRRRLLCMRAPWNLGGSHHGRPPVSRDEGRGEAISQQIA
jgi:hypothetical protein